MSITDVNKSTNIKDIFYLLENEGAMLVGSRALDVSNEESDWDYLMEIENLCELRHKLTEYYDFYEIYSSSNPDYGSLMRFRNDEYNIDVFALTTEMHSVYKQTHEILSKFPTQWIKDKENRIILTNILQISMGRKMSLDKSCPFKHDISFKLHKICDVTNN